MSEDLSGFWAGRYIYPGSFPPPVDFDLELIHSGDTLSGHITEPNTFIEGEGALAVAVISGTLSGQSVKFVKTYRGAHDVAYQGVLNGDRTHIEGTWSVGWYSGKFILQRETGRTKKALREAELEKQN